MDDPIARRFYRRDEIAGMTGLSQSQIDKMIAEGTLGKVKVGRAVLIPAADVDRIFSNETQLDPSASDDDA